MLSGWQLVSTGWGNGLAPNNFQTIYSTNNNRVHWRSYASLGFGELGFSIEVIVAIMTTVYDKDVTSVPWRLKALIENSPICSSVPLGYHQRKYQNPCYSTLIWGTHWLVDFTHAGPIIREAFLCHNVVIGIQFQESAIITQVTAILPSIFGKVKQLQWGHCQGFWLFDNCKSASATVFLFQYTYLQTYLLVLEWLKYAKTHFNIDVQMWPKINLGHLFLNLMPADLWGPQWLYIGSKDM